MIIFLLESVVLSLIGLQLPTLIRDLSCAEAWPAEALAVTGTLLVIRSCGCSRCLRSSSGAAGLVAAAVGALAAGVAAIAGIGRGMLLLASSFLLIARGWARGLRGLYPALACPAEVSGA